MMRKRSLTFGVLLSALLALAPPASASPWNRSCEGGGAVGPEDSSYNSEYFIGHVHVSMNPGEAIRLARRQPREEFGYRVTARGVICLVGLGIAFDAGNKWVNWSGNTGWVNVHTTSSGGSSYVGLYRCVGIAGDGNNWERERCTTSFAGGKVTGTFRIDANPAFMA